MSSGKISTQDHPHPIVSRPNLIIDTNITKKLKYENGIYSAYKVAVMLIRVWEKKFGAEIRAVAKADFNRDGVDEIVIASWGSKIYTLSGAGDVLWSSKKQEYPCENLGVLYNSLGKPTQILASCHKKLVSLSPAGEVMWSRYFDSWITRIEVFNRYGRESDIYLIDLRGKLYSISTEGEILWVLEDVAYSWSSIIYFDEIGCILTTRGTELRVISIDGKPVRRLNLRSKGLSIGMGNLVKKRMNIIAVGCDNYVEVFDEDLKPIQRIRQKNYGHYRLVSFFDVDGDSDDELVFGSWIGDSVSIYKFDETKEKFTMMKRYKLDTNPTHVSGFDVDGDRISEVFIVDSNGKTLMIDDGKKIKIDTLNSYHGITFGNFIGYGEGDILMRTAKENIACFVYIPRIKIAFSSTESVGTIYAVLPAGSKVDADPIVTMDTKRREYTRKTYDKKTVIFYKIPFRAKYSGKKVRIRVAKGKDRILETIMLVPASGRLDAFTNVIELADEDTIIINDIKAPPRSKITATSDILGIMEAKALNQGIRLTVSHNLDREAPIRITIESKSRSKSERKEYGVIVIPIKTIDVDISYAPKMTTNDSIIVSIRNNANKKIPFKIHAEKIGAKVEGAVREKAITKAKIRPRTKADTLKIEVRDRLMIEYGEYIRRRIQIPIRFVLFNMEAINMKAKKIYAVTKDKKVVIRNLSEELGITPDELKKMIKL